MRFPSRPQRPYILTCIRPGCGKRYEAHYPPTHQFCGGACAMAFHPSDAQVQAWLTVAAKSRETGKGKAA